MRIMSHRKRRTITTGPFHIPQFNVFSQQNRLIVEIKNPTNKPLKVDEVILGVCRAPATFTPPLQLHNNQLETEMTLFSDFEVAPHSCRRIERVIPTTDLRGTYRLTTKGEYKVDDGRPVCGKLEIYVTFGANFSGASSGLDKAEESISFPYSAFLVCKNRSDDDDDDNYDGDEF